MARLRGVDGVVPAVLADGKRGGPGGGAGRSIEMDAVEFIRERNRMCKHFRGCAGCPADGMICSTIGGMNDAERLVQIVEEWAEEHPRKTRQSEFLEQYPEARVDKDGILVICPAAIAKKKRDEYGGCASPTGNCPECRRRFWQQEVE
jgi:hypothetical protein